MRVEADGEPLRFRYDLGECQGYLALALDPAPTRSGRDGQAIWVEGSGTTFTACFTVADDHDGPLDEDVLGDAAALGYEGLRQEHLAFWQDYFARSSISLPDPQLQYLYDTSMYHFKAMQNPISGGLPVNNLRLTWSSHVFWDAYFIQQALLEANHLHEAREGTRFLQHTLDHARRHAREEFNAPGLKWDWEITHDGRKAYGAWLHQKEQMHNNGSYANMIWSVYELTGDREFLADYAPILHGLAEFFLHNVVEETEQGRTKRYEIRPLVGVEERPEWIKNEGLDLAATVRILRLAAQTATLLGQGDEFTSRCTVVADGLMKTVDRLYNGRHFQSAEGNEHMNTSSLAPIYPMRLIAWKDPRAVSTARAYFDGHEGRPIGYSDTATSSFPWTAGWLATILAHQGDTEAAWDCIERARPAIGMHGGMAEVAWDWGWNMMYFGTAQGAICTALHSLLLQNHADEVRLFPAIPEAWRGAGFQRLLSGGLEVSAELDRGAGRVRGAVRNITPAPLTRTLRWGERAQDVRAQTVELAPGEVAEFDLS
jgi:alpha-L-fucosidase 2